MEHYQEIPVNNLVIKSRAGTATLPLVADISPEELGREIERLWARVGAASSEPLGSVVLPPLNEPAFSMGQAAWETVALLKRQHRQQARRWAEIIEAKERALAAARERQARLELEVNALRQQAQTQEGVLLKEGFEIQARLEAVLAALREKESDRP